MSSKFGQIRSGTTEFAKKSMLPLFLVSQLWLYLGNSQLSVYRTIGPLVLLNYVPLKNQDEILSESISKSIKARN